MAHSELASTVSFPYLLDRQGWLVVSPASILLGAVIGALTCSWLSERRGRKGTLVMLSVVFVVGALWCAFSPNPVMLSLGRLVLGFAVGGATQTAPMYVAELSPPKYRGGWCCASRSRSVSAS